MQTFTLPQVKTMNTNLTTVTVPLTSQEHKRAQAAVVGVKDPKKIKQIYLNCLSTLAVDYFLSLMKFETDLQSSESHNPVIRAVRDVADLTIKHIGRVECRPVMENQAQITLPQDVQSDRVAYIMVQFMPELTEAKLLGFITQPQPEIEVAQLQSMEALLEHLTTLEPV